MNIVEFALKLKDMASMPLRNFGTTAGQTFTRAKAMTDNLSTHNRVLGLSYNELQAKIKQVENTIRTSTIPSQIRAARKELEALQRQSANHAGNTSGSIPSGKSSGGGLMGSAGGLLKGAAIIGGLTMAVGAISQLADAGEAAYKAQSVAETRLTAVMHNTMGARKEDVKSIIDFATAQEKLGVIGADVQIAGAQELSTYLTKKETLQSLIPIMNDMTAQQFGLSASQEQSVGIATMLGKVMDGQVGGLSRYGYKFDKAQEKILQFGTEAQRAATLIEVVNGSVQGVNAALAATPEGLLKQQENAIGGLQVRFGSYVVQAKAAFAPLISVAMEFAEKLLPVLEQFIQPLASGVQLVVEWIKEAQSSTGGWMDYINIIKNVLVNNVFPVFQKLWNLVFNIVTSLFDFIKNSELLKDIFSVIYTLFGQVYDIIGFVVDALSWIFNSIIMPIINGIEKAYRFAKELLGGDVTINQQATVTTVSSPLEKKDQQTTQQLLSNIAGNTAANNASAKGTESSISGGGQKIVNIQMPKFLDNINIYPASVTEGVNDMERMMREMFARILLEGGY